MESHTIQVDEPRGAKVDVNIKVPSTWAAHKWYEKTYVPPDFISRPPNEGRLDFKAQAMVFASVSDAVADFKARLPSEGGYVEEIVSGDLPQGGQYASVKILYPEGSSSLNHPGLACQSIMHKPGMSYVICTTASARLDMLKNGDTWDRLVEACKATDLTHELPKSEFGDLDFGFDE